MCLVIMGIGALYYTHSGSSFHFLSGHCKKTLMLLASFTLFGPILGSWATLDTCNTDMQQSMISGLESGAQALEISRKDAIELLDLRQGEHILDAGCGIGGTTYVFADKVGASGFVTGMDASAVMIAAAQQRQGNRLFNGEFVQGSVMKLNFSDATFDASYIERVLQHVPDPTVGVSELARVVRRCKRQLAEAGRWRAAAGRRRGSTATAAAAARASSRVS